MDLLTDPRGLDKITPTKFWLYNHSLETKSLLSLVNILFVLNVTNILVLINRKVEYIMMLFLSVELLSLFLREFFFVGICFTVDFWPKATFPTETGKIMYQ